MTDESKTRLERLKDGLLKWKEAHEDEYNSFARIMRSGDASCYMRFYRSIMLTMPQLHKAWKRNWESDTACGFEDFTVRVRESDMPGELVEMCERRNDSEIAGTEKPVSFADFLKRIIGIKPKPKVRLSAPLILCWLYFGQSFESMVDMLNAQLRSGAADNMDKDKCSFAVRAVIDTSIKSGYRTKQDWNRYFERRRAIDTGNVGEWAVGEISAGLDDARTEAGGTDAATDTARTAGRRKADARPLADYLDCDNKEAVISVVRNFITGNNTGNGLALPFFALSALNLFTRMLADKEYSVAVARQFEDIGNLKSESSCRQSLGNLRKEQYVIINGRQERGTLLESDEYASKLERLKKDIEAAKNRVK